MSFTSSNAENYLKIYENPEKGFELLKMFGKNINVGNIDIDLILEKKLEKLEKKLQKEHRSDEKKGEIPEKDIIIELIDMDLYQTENEDEQKQFNISLFGKTKLDESVYIHVDGFYPIFYVEIDERWRKGTIDRIMADIKKRVRSKEKREGLTDYKIVQKCKFVGFTAEKKFSFLELKFRDYDSMRAYSYIFQEKHKLYYISSQKAIGFNIYESNINPLLRFLHTGNFDPAGWIGINKESYKDFKYEYRKGDTNFNICCDWEDIRPIDSIDVHKFRIMSFDIECDSEDGKFPTNRDGDKVIQIGMTYSNLGEGECFKKTILCLEDTDEIPGAEVICFYNEEDLLMEFTNQIKKMDPDFIIGYNINGFDFNYLKNRAQKFGIMTRFSKMSRINGHICEFKDITLASSALGKNLLKYYVIPGRVIIDLMKVIQKEHKLKSYSLDSVVANFIRGDVNNLIINPQENIFEFTTKSTEGLYVGDYIAMMYKNGCIDERLGKYQIKYLENDKIILDGNIDEEYSTRGLFWCHGKDDIDPKDIFRYFKKDSKSRSLIAKYCLQDCALCNRLIDKLNIIPNAINMSNVCNVPISYNFFRGQGVKIFSMVSKFCREEEHLIPVLKKKKSKNDKEEKKEETKWKKFINSLIYQDEKYEGATVFDPIKGVHYSPVIVYDFGSLYPSCMRMKNLSHDSIVLDSRYDNLPGYIYHEQSYTNSDGSISTHRFAEKIDGKKAILPRILEILLTRRKECQEKMKLETDPFKKSVLDGRQIALKIVANTVYGQSGAPTSDIYCKPIAACTTSIGREMLELAKNFSEKILPKIINLIVENKQKEYIKFMEKLFSHVDESKIKMEEKIKGDDGIVHVREVYNGKEQYFEYLKKEIYGMMKNCTIDPECIYGDTDSIFFKMNMKDKVTGEKMEDIEALKICIRMGIISSGIVNYTLTFPQVLNYEKVYWPFIIISKKRYVGNLYEFSHTKFYQKSMGLVTKRRDNSDIVKYTVGGIIDYILNKRDKLGAINFTKQTLKKIIMGNFDISKFIITKTLKDKEDYADWTRMAHVVLAERMGQRDSGNKPQSNDRIPYAYIETTKNKKFLKQGDMIEHSKYIIDNNMKIDFLFYITNQIMKPSMQFLELIAENPKSIFNMYIMREQNRKGGTEPIMKFFKEDGCYREGNNIINLNAIFD
jgi:DNA polymerase elongation subunit (family B)